MKSARIPFLAAIIIAVVFSLSACVSSRPPFRAYPGNQKTAGETALFVFVNPSFISIVPYKVDGKAHTEDPDTKVLQGTYLAWNQLNTEIEFLPGQHSIEFYAVDTTPVKHFAVKLTLEKGKKYVMKGTTNNFSITSEGKSVPYEVSPVPILEEPDESKKYATLTFEPGKGGFKSVAYLLRIDGRVRNSMYKLHPRWTTMNYSGLARGIVTSVGGSGMLIQGNVEAKEGYFSIRIAPGHHKIEYFAEAFLLAQRSLGRLVRIAEFDAEAGKKYSIIIVPDSEKSLDGIIENGIKIVAE